MKKDSSNPFKIPLTKRLWWFDVVYPLTLAAILLLSVTLMMYSGTRQMRVSSIADNTMLQFSLTRLPSWSASEGGVLIVDFDSSVPLTERIAMMTKAVERLVESKTANIYLAWDNALQTASTELDPLYAVIANSGESKVTIAAPYGWGRKLPAKMKDLVAVVEDSPCNEAQTLQTHCSFDRSWSDWVVQAIVNDLGESNREETPAWVNEQLNNSFPSYILNLPDSDTIPTIKISDESEIDSFSPDLDGKIAFLGPTDISEAKSLITTGNLNGAPLHKFWAGIAQMYIQDNLVVVPRLWVTWTVVTFLCVFICLVMWRFGGSAALGMFMVYAVAAPFVNTFSIRNLNVYVPVYDSYYFGLMTFIVTGFGRLSYSAFARWRLEEQKKIHTKTADLKSNFISLLSHNLNTPVAKMQGMLALLSMQKDMAKDQPTVRLAEHYVAQLELGIKGVLIGTTIAEGSLNETPRHLKGFIEDFEGAYKGPLSRLGVTIKEFSFSTSDDDYLHLPVVFDQRAVSASLCALCALFAQTGSVTQVRVIIGVDLDTPGESRIKFAVECNESWITRSATKLLDREKVAVRNLHGENFFEEVQIDLIKQVARTYHGDVYRNKGQDGGQLEMTMVCSE